MQETRILIVDDDASFRNRVRRHLFSEPDLEIVGEAADGLEALRMARELQPDLVLMDVRMPGMNGLAATQQLKAELPRMQIIMLTMYDLPEYRDAALASGASGYITKRSLYDELVPLIRSVLPPGGRAGQRHRQEPTLLGGEKCKKTRLGNN
ncbi:MAG: response regulator transcription factor [Chloroflexi bacterium]|nr:response regulator transcription factor [Chloroflexota bacterium]MBU1747432.1 response regulator transcription factor [Chloroflexota bacterium]